MVLPHEKAVLCCICVVDVFRTHWQKHMLFQTGKKGSIKSETAELHENPGCAKNGQQILPFFESLKIRGKLAAGHLDD